MRAFRLSGVLCAAPPARHVSRVDDRRPNSMKSLSGGDQIARRGSCQTVQRFSVRDRVTPLRRWRWCRLLAQRQDVTSLITMSKRRQQDRRLSAVGVGAVDLEYLHVIVPRFRSRLFSVGPANTVASRKAKAEGRCPEVGIIANGSKTKHGLRFR